jgi:hypothetical protein
MEQVKLDIPKDKRETRITIKLNHADMIALQRGMERVGEVNKSSYIRRLIHDGKQGK